MIEEIDELTTESLVDEAMDVEYEFDAPRYFDFSQPETNAEAQQADRWFGTAVSDPPSPYVVKLNLGTDDGSDTTICTGSDCGATVSYILSTSDENFGEDQHTPRAKAKSTAKPTHSTLMKSTAGSINMISVRPKPKVTVPKEPALATARRAQIRRSKENVDSCAHAVPNAQTSRACPLNKKPLKSCLSLPKMFTADLLEFQEANVRNSGSSYHGTSEARRRNTIDAPKHEKCGRVKKSRSCCNMKELKSPSDKRPNYEPPVELFSKLSLASEPNNSRSQSKLSLTPKGSRANQKLSQVINVVEGKSERFGRKQLQCGSISRIPPIPAQTSTNRSFKIS